MWNLFPASLRKSCDHLAKAKLRKNKVTTQDDKMWGSFKTVWQNWMKLGIEDPFNHGNGSIEVF